MHNRMHGPRQLQQLSASILNNDDSKAKEHRHSRNLVTVINDSNCNCSPRSTTIATKSKIHALSTNKATGELPRCPLQQKTRKRKRMYTSIQMRQNKVARFTFILLVGAICSIFSRNLFVNFLVRISKQIKYLKMMKSKPTSTSKVRRNKGRGRSIKSIMSPFDSHPPKVISMDPSRNIRHSCLHEIRNQQKKYFVPYLQHANHVLLVDPAYHSNVGDHMITIAELTFLRQQPGQRTKMSTATTTKTISQCSYIQAHDFVPSCNTIIETEINHPNHIVQTYTNSSGMTLVANPDSHERSRDHSNKIALWHGGGNFGNLWSTAQQARIQSIVVLLQANYTIIGMPNSWFYTNSTTITKNNILTNTENKDIQQIRSNIVLGLGLESTISDEQLAKVSKSRVIWTWREHYSYERAQLLLPYCTHQLIPDIAFQLGPYQSNHQYNSTSMSLSDGMSINSKSNDPTATVKIDIVLLLRNDHESVYSSFRNRQAIQNILNSIPGAEYLSFSIVDWDDRLFRFQNMEISSTLDDIYFTETSIQLLSMGRILICDRLHAAILAYISNISFIYLDQISGKIHKTFTVAMESGLSCERSSNLFKELLHSNVSVPSVYDDTFNIWSHAETISEAIEKAVHAIKLQEQH